MKYVIDCLLTYVNKCQISEFAWKYVFLQKYLNLT